MDMLHQPIFWAELAAIVWINPLLGTPGYEPTATGMSLARPHVAVLASVPDPLALRALAPRLSFT